jgi:hypothetical protein
MVPLENGLAYALRIVPRNKREGLISGVLWVAGETGTAVREPGSGEGPFDFHEARQSDAWGAPRG